MILSRDWHSSGQRIMLEFSFAAYVVSSHPPQLICNHRKAQDEGVAVLARMMDRQAVRGAYVLIGLITILSGQGCMIPQFADSDAEANLDAIGLVLSAAYTEGGFDRSVLFVEIGDACDSIAGECAQNESRLPESVKAVLEVTLGVKVHPNSEADRTSPDFPVLTPVLPETGEVGVYVRLGRFRATEDGLLEVPVDILRSGLNGELTTFTLENMGNGWVVRNIVVNAIA